MMAGAAVLLTACSSDEWNTDSGVTVEMANATMKVKENAGKFYVPLKLTGTTNGPVKVSVAVSEYTESPAKEDVHYILTSYSVVFPNDSADVKLEFVAVNDMDINDDRSFIVTITNVEGATLGAQTTTEVTIRDDDGIVYEAIQGEWKWNCMNYFDDVAESYTMNLLGVNEGEADYEKVLHISGFGGQSALGCEMEYEYDEGTKEVFLYLPFGQVLGQLNFTGLGVCDVVVFGVSGGYLVEDGGAYATVSSDLRTITFDEGTSLIYYVMQNGQGMGAWDGCYDIIMTR